MVFQNVLEKPFNKVYNRNCFSYQFFIFVAIVMENKFRTTLLKEEKRHSEVYDLQGKKGVVLLQL